MVECEASMFPLVNLTKVSTAAHSIQYFNLQLSHGQRATFWRLSFFNSKYLLAPSGAGLIFTPVPASPASTAGGGGSPSYSGFFHCLAVFDNRSSPCLTQAAVYRVWVSYPMLLLVHPVQSSFAWVFDLEAF